MKPRRALVLFYDEGEDITGDSLRARLEAKAYRIVERPAVQPSTRGVRLLLGVIAMPDDALEADKRRQRAREEEAERVTTVEVKPDVFEMLTRGTP